MSTHNTNVYSNAGGNDATGGTQSINGSTEAAQFFTVSTNASPVAWTDSGGTHNINIPPSALGTALRSINGDTTLDQYIIAGSNTIVNSSGGTITISSLGGTAIEYINDNSNGTQYIVAGSNILVNSVNGTTTITGSAAGILSLNDLTASTQTFTGTGVTITSSGTNHDFFVPNYIQYINDNSNGTQYIVAGSDINVNSINGTTTIAGSGSIKYINDDSNGTQYIIGGSNIHVASTSGTTIVFGSSAIQYINDNSNGTQYIIGGSNIAIESLNGTTTVAGSDAIKYINDNSNGTQYIIAGSNIHVASTSGTTIVWGSAAIQYINDDSNGTQYIVGGNNIYVTSTAGTTFVTGSAAGIQYINDFNIGTQYLRGTNGIEINSVAGTHDIGLTLTGVVAGTYGGLYGTTASTTVSTQGSKLIGTTVSIYDSVTIPQYDVDDRGRLHYSTAGTYLIGSTAVGNLLGIGGNSGIINNTNHGTGMVTVGGNVYGTVPIPSNANVVNIGTISNTMGGTISNTNGYVSIGGNIHVYLNSNATTQYFDVNSIAGSGGINFIGTSGGTYIINGITYLNNNSSGTQYIVGGSNVALTSTAGTTTVSLNVPGGTNIGYINNDLTGTQYLVGTNGIAVTTLSGTHTFDGLGAITITSINGQGQQVQYLTISTNGTALEWTDTTGTHNLNIPPSVSTAIQYINDSASGTQYFIAGSNTSVFSTQGTTTVSAFSPNVLTPTTSVSNGTQIVGATDYFVYVDYTTTGAVGISIPIAQLTKDRLFCFVDSGGSAQTNNITITPESPTTISGSPTYVINTNYGAVSLITNGTNLFVY